VKVLIIAEYYPRSYDPVLGIWAHRQALATKQAGADVRVLVLHRVVPPLSAVKSLDIKRALVPFKQPINDELDGIKVHYLPFISPPKSMSYPSWSKWIAPTLKVAMKRISKQFDFDLIHAHYALPAGDAVLRSNLNRPIVVSIHGGDILGVAPKSSSARKRISGVLTQASYTVANSLNTADRCREFGAKRVKVVTLGTDLPKALPIKPSRHKLVTVGHLVKRKRHCDVLKAVSKLADKYPELIYTVIGSGPELEQLQRLAEDLAISDRVTFKGQLSPSSALQESWNASIAVMPSVDEAFGVAYIEAMAGYTPTVGCIGEAGPEQIAAKGSGIELVTPQSPQALAERLDSMLSDSEKLEALGQSAHRTVVDNFTWERCGENTLSVYNEALDAK